MVSGLVSRVSFFKTLGSSLDSDASGIFSHCLLCLSLLLVFEAGSLNVDLPDLPGTNRVGIKGKSHQAHPVCSLTDWSAFLLP